MPLIMQSLIDDACDICACRQSGIGQNTHQPHVGATVHKANATFTQCCTQRLRRFCVNARSTKIGATKHGYFFKRLRHALISRIK